MYSVYQHWDPLKTCMVGKSYPPEFYSWIKNPKTRSVFERIAQETEEDYQSLIKILKKFNVEVLRPEIPDDFSQLYNTETERFIPPPMTPRDVFGTYGNTLVHSFSTINDHYKQVSDPSWPEIYTFADLKNLDSILVNEIQNTHKHFFTNVVPSDKQNRDIFYGKMLDSIKNKCIVESSVTDNPLILTCSARTTKAGKDLYIADDLGAEYFENNFSEYRVHSMNVDYHTDGAFCPVVPGLIISITDVKTYKDTFPGWEVVYLPNQSWDKVKPFLELKVKNQGKWWIPGEEYNDDVISTVDTWMSKWVGYVEETVFDVNMLVINEKNVIVNNYNKQVFDAFDRYGITPHICNFRHRYFWDGGLHCITLDLDREGEMKDYFPERA